jgi:hypothetical protein
MQNQQKFQMQVLSAIGKMNEKIDLIWNEMKNQGSRSTESVASNQSTQLELAPQKIPLILGENVFIRSDTYRCCDCKKNKND